MLTRKKQFISKYFYGENIVDLDEFVISLADSCSLKCEYCYLKFSKTPKKPVVYQNIENLTYELENLFKNSNKKIFYFHLGETTDSFLTPKHIQLLKKCGLMISSKAKIYSKNCFIEVRTKTSNIIKFFKDNLHFDNLKFVYAVSLSPQIVIEKFEKNTSNLEERIETLRYAQNLGFLVGLKLEPIIIYPVFDIDKKGIIKSIRNTSELYIDILKRTLKIVDIKNLHSITLSTLRLTKKQFKILKEKKSELCFPEMNMCSDGKLRYSRPIRVTIYRDIINFLSSIDKQLKEKTLLSFEFDYIWDDCDLKIKTTSQLANEIYETKNS